MMARILPEHLVPEAVSRINDKSTISRGMCVLRVDSENR